MTLAHLDVMDRGARDANRFGVGASHEKDGVAAGWGRGPNHGLHATMAKARSFRRCELHPDAHRSPCGVRRLRPESDRARAEQEHGERAQSESAVAPGLYGLRISAQPSMGFRGRGYKCRRPDWLSRRSTGNYALRTFCFA